jgi:SAM-dependent methyltransferase
MTRRVAYEMWRVRHADDRAALVGALGREFIGRTMPFIRRQLPMPRGREDKAPRYLRVWVKREGSLYRRAVYQRQRHGGTRPLGTNPTIEEISAALRAHRANAVLELGCGWGRLLEQLTTMFDAAGCDVSPEMLALCRRGLNVFRLDIASENRAAIREHVGRWDVLFSRGVMQYFDEPAVLARAMANLLALGPRKILVWEWPEVCDRMRETCDDSTFEYHPIAHADE